MTHRPSPAEQVSVTGRRPANGSAGPSPRSATVATMRSGASHRRNRTGGRPWISALVTASLTPRTRESMSVGASFGVSRCGVSACGASAWTVPAAVGSDRKVSGRAVLAAWTAPRAVAGVGVVRAVTRGGGGAPPAAPGPRGGGGQVGVAAGDVVEDGAGGDACVVGAQAPQWELGVGTVDGGFVASPPVPRGPDTGMG